ncbi:MAG: tetratricopeptide repeat protein [Cyanobacteria bacterium TGS_CYA1]|nr:tetratricopeptide repeat protein [Cyanobacteria bacterium TGS_CYA1]
MRKNTLHTATFYSLVSSYSIALLFSIAQTDAWAGEVRVYEDAAMIEAKELVCKNDLPGAHILLNKILLTSPNSIPALDLLTFSDVYLEDYAAVLKNCNKMLSIDPYNISALNRRSYYFLNTNKLPQALQDLNKLATILPDDSTIQTNRVKALRKLGKNKEADAILKTAEKAFWTTQAILSPTDTRRKFFVTDLTERIKTEPKNFLIPLARAHLLIKLGSEDKAINDLNKVLANDKSLELKALWLRGQAYKKRRQFDKAIVDLTKIVDSKPGTRLIYWSFEPLCPHNLKNTNWERVLYRLKDVYLERARLYLETHNFEKAAADCTAALNADSIFIPALETRAMAYDSLNQQTKKADDYKKMCQITNGRDDYLYELARTYQQLARHKEAVEILSQLIKQNSNDDNLIEARASSFSALKNYSDAIKDYDTLLKMDPRDSTFWKMRGIAFLGSKNHPNAVRDLTKAIELGAGAPALLKRAEAYQAMGRKDLAEKDLASARKRP